MLFLPTPSEYLAAKAPPPSAARGEELVRLHQRSRVLKPALKCKGDLIVVSSSHSILCTL